MRHLLPHLLAASLLAVAVGCDLPGIPLHLEPGQADAGVGADGGPVGPQVCAPSSRSCRSSTTLSICSDDGADFQIEVCGDGTTCIEGACTPIESSCRYGQPFALSTDELVYDVTADFKSQTRVVTLTNCGVQPLRIRDAIVRAPDRPDGRPVFRLTDDSPKGGTLQPGASATFKVLYEPTAGLSQVRGTLQLGLTTDSPVLYEVELRTRSYCVTATPVLDMGPIEAGEPHRETIFLQNCGTEPVNLRTVAARTDAHSDSPPPWQIALDPAIKLPSRVYPGEEVAVEVRVVGEPGAVIDDAVLFGFEELEASVEPATTQLRAVALAAACDEGLTTPPVRVTVRNVVVQSEPALVPPLEIVRLVPQIADGDEGLGLALTLVEQPDVSHLELSRQGRAAYFQPTVVGDYAVEALAFDPVTGRPACDPRVIELRVRPEQPVHVELTWRALGDAIAGDAGFGRGANLDLHVLAGAGMWNGEDDCFPGASMPCGAALGTVAVKSQSGDQAEVVWFDEMPEQRLKFGVYLSNIFNFEAVDARLRLYVDGELAGEVDTGRLQTPNDFWLVGAYDPASDEFDVTDIITTSFPR